MFILLLGEAPPLKNVRELNPWHDDAGANVETTNHQPHSEEAASYDAKHEKATAEIARRLEARRAFIGVQWVEEASTDDEGDGRGGAEEPARAVRLLDYACGTGAMTRVGVFLFILSLLYGYVGSDNDSTLTSSGRLWHPTPRSASASTCRRTW